MELQRKRKSEIGASSLQYVVAVALLAVATISSSTEVAEKTNYVFSLGGTTISGMSDDDSTGNGCEGNIALICNQTLDLEDPEKEDLSG